MKKEIKWIEKRSWQEMRDSGLLWFINRMLHLFGRAIVFVYNKDKNNKITTIKEVYFARCRYRGFDDKSIGENYKKVTNYLKENIKELQEDIEL